MRRRRFLILIAWFISLQAFAASSEDAHSSQSVEMIVWEYQDWEPNGGYKRLTIWRNGHSQVEVSPHARWSVSQMNVNIQPKSGWTAARQEHHVMFVRKGIYPPEVAREKMQQALEAGIQFLETFRPGYRDGSGTRVVVQINGQQKETIIPMFMDANKGTSNHKRFLAVSKILNGFATDAYEIPGK
jgi:VCBS repeat-containing protein